jgi:hypothetical protein
LEDEFVENRESIKFVKYYYPEHLEEKDIRNNHVDIYVKFDEVLNEQEVDSYFQRLESFEPAFPLNKKTINILDTKSPENIQATSVPELIRKYMEQQSFENKEEIVNLLFELHDDCKNAM